MKKLNNKGFAITTVIYGLSIMAILLISILMATLSANRVNSKQLSQSIEDELNRFSKTATSFEANGDTTQEYIVPEKGDGWYRIELWGAQGGGENGGLGAYTSGIIHLTEGMLLNFYIGRDNGDGKGGESTDVRILGGKYDNFISYDTRIMVAAGGGANANAHGGTLKGYTANMASLGGYIDVRGDFSLKENTKTNGTLIGAPATYTEAEQNTIFGPIPGVAGGGSGYLSSNSPDVGGTSFISGYAGVNAYVEGSNSNNTLYTYHKSTFNEEDATLSYETEGIPYYFVDSYMYPGVNRGNGKAKIERIISDNASPEGLIKKNTKLNGVRYIRDCIGDGSNAGAKIYAIKDGLNLAAGKALIEDADPSRVSSNCRTVDLGNVFDLDEIAVFHKNTGVDYSNNTITVSNNQTFSPQVFLKNNSNDAVGAISKSETETVNGTHISAYQFDSTLYLPPKGTYYIVPVTSENKVISAKENAVDDNNPLSIEYMDGTKRQKWSIEQITDPNITPAGAIEYKIVEVARYHALQLYQEENIVGNRVSANTSFNNISRNNPQIWNIIPTGNGTYVIKTAVPASEAITKSGNIIPQTNVDVSDYYENIIIGKQNYETERFKLIAVENANG